MITPNDIHKAIINDQFKPEEMVTILELIDIKLNILTVSKMARAENKSPNGVRMSNCYKKLVIGGQLMVTKKLRNK